MSSALQTVASEILPHKLDFFLSYREKKHADTPSKEKLRRQARRDNLPFRANIEYFPMTVYWHFNAMGKLNLSNNRFYRN